jgi:hypothetical protein
MAPAGVTGSRRRASGAAALVLVLLAPGCATARPDGARTAPPREQPGRTIEQTLQSAIRLLERHECAAFAVDFLSPIRRAEIKDLEAYRRERQCTPDNRGNLDDVLLALRLGLGAEPEIRGVRAIIDLSGIGTRIARLELVRYTDGRWYFNGF